MHVLGVRVYKHARYSPHTSQR